MNKAKHPNTGNQHARKDVTKDAVLTIRLRQKSKDKALRDAKRAGKSTSQHIEDLINQ